MLKIKRELFLLVHLRLDHFLTFSMVKDMVPKVAPTRSPCPTTNVMEGGPPGTNKGSFNAIKIERKPFLFLDLFPDHFVASLLVNDIVSKVVPTGTRTESPNSWKVRHRVHKKRR